jgi:hypothetical protein
MQRLRILLRDRIALVEQRNEVHNHIRDLFATLRQLGRFSAG